MHETDRIDARLAGWRSPEGRRAYLVAYEAALSLWPVPFESHQVDTRFGATHVVASGSTESSPLVLLHAATGFGATQWYPNAAALSEHYRVYAVDFIGSAGKGTQTRAILSRADCGDWVADVIQGLGLERTAVVGSSQGGWLALNLALLRPELVDALALLAPAGAIVPIRPLMRLFIRLGPMMPAWTGPPSIRGLFGGRAPVDERIVTLLTLHLKHFRYQRHAVFPTALPEEELRGLSVAVLLLIGEHEVIYPPESTIEKAMRVLPKVEAERVDGVGHLINMERPGFTNERLLQFFSQHAVD